jgi:hypothetical protein
MIGHANSVINQSVHQTSGRYGGHPLHRDGRVPGKENRKTWRVGSTAHGRGIHIMRPTVNPNDVINILAAADLAIVDAFGSGFLNDLHKKTFVEIFIDVFISDEEVGWGIDVSVNEAPEIIVAFLVDQEADRSALRALDGLELRVFAGWDVYPGRIKIGVKPRRFRLPPSSSHFARFQLGDCWLHDGDTPWGVLRQTVVGEADATEMQRRFRSIIHWLDERSIPYGLEWNTWQDLLGCDYDPMVMIWQLGLRRRPIRRALFYLLLNAADVDHAKVHHCEILTSPILRDANGHSISLPLFNPYSSCNRLSRHKLKLAIKGETNND